MKEQILKLRSEGKSYNQIKEILGCSKGTISYHCGNGQKEKTAKRRKKRRKNAILKRVDRFKSVKYKKKNSDLLLDKEKEHRLFVESIRKFQKRSSGNGKYVIDKDIETTFTWKDVIEVYGENTHCYLSGVPINLYKNNYEIDHIIPVSRGGDNTFSNFGITHKVINQMKSNLMVEEFIMWCIKVLEFNGYDVKKNGCSSEAEQ